MANKRFRTKHEWQAILEAYKKSGLSQKTFCSQNNLPLSSFYRWRQLLADCNTKATETSLVKIEKPVNFHEKEASISTSYCRIMLQGTESEQQLVTIFRALRIAGNDH